MHLPSMMCTWHQGVGGTHKLRAAAPGAVAVGAGKGFPASKCVFFFFTKTSKRRFGHVVTVNILFCQGIYSTPRYMRTRVNGISRASL